MVREMDVTAFVRELRADLSWDPAEGGGGADKQAFVEALTAVAALPLDSLSMEARRLLVASPDGSAPHVQRVVAALESRDVLLKCKAANAVGSLCTSRVAGQVLLDAVGERVLRALARMAVCRNQWAQGDALFVLGWVVVIADEALVAAAVALVPQVLRCLLRNLRLVLSPARPTDDKTAALVSSEQATNFRVYSLVLLLNLSQRDPSVFAPHLDALTETLVDAARVLLTYRRLDANDQSPAIDAAEFAELLRLTVTLTSLLLGTLDGVGERLLELKMVPLLLKLKRMALESEAGSEASDQDEADDDIVERLTALTNALLGREELSLVQNGSEIHH